MRRINQKPLSTNDQWQGRRFPTPIYKAFKRITTILLNVVRPPKPPDAPLFAHYRWGVSNILSDVDNPCKSFQDVLFNYWNMKDKDHRVRFLILEKVKTNKGEEFIEFHVDDETKELVPYLESLLAELKGE